PNLMNLVGIFGDSPDDPDRECDNPLCFLQIEGTGETDEDVVIRGGFKESDGDWIDNHNGIMADRADGFYVKDVTVELFRENAIYVLETNGYVMDGTVTRYNDLYGLLSFSSDRGLMKDCVAHHAGDGAIYPGSPSDIYADADFTGPLPRPVVEITGCDVHHSALGHSATAGNGIYLHHNNFHHNQTGIVVDSFVPNHPGMPVDHNWMEHNKVWANNENFYEEFLHTGICDKPPAERGYEEGTVCPAFPLPVGTGILIGGGNHSYLRNNQIYDNWRAGVMQFWVPGAIREDITPEAQYDTSHDNHYVANRMGFAPGGLTQPNGVDFWWDDQGSGNCWQDNTSAGGEVTSNTIFPTGLPDCDSGGSVWDPGNPVKSAGLVPCATYDREDNPDPPGCDWFITPQEPEGRESASGNGGSDGNGGGTDGEGGDDGALAADDEAGAGSGPSLPATGGGALLALLGAAGLGTAAAIGRRRRLP
ncbi:MAG TPA: right-handed parallel beta-helix repeat-containing protein, partial [Actinoplanes sp.]|nr:right-handed parallel beta-helix repeat-containing protein [Actinoplanes sp.]